MAGNEEMYLIPRNVVVAIGEYLSQRPWSEVEQVMPILRSLSPAPDYQKEALAENAEAPHGE